MLYNIHIINIGLYRDQLVYAHVPNDIFYYRVRNAHHEKSKSAYNFTHTDID